MDLMINPKPKNRVRTTLNTGLLIGILAALSLTLLAAFGMPGPPPTPTPEPLAEELIFYNWADYMPQSTLDAFTEEYGVKITYLTYDTQEEAVENMRAGEVYDVAIIENEFIPTLLREDLLAEIDYRNVLNFDNVSDNFRNLAYDPDNAHSVPDSWGTSGLVVRTDLVEEPVTSWADLWNPRYAGKIALRDSPHEVIGAALKSLGHSINSEDPDELAAAEELLKELKKQDIIFVDSTTEGAVAAFAGGETAILLGWPGDALGVREQNETVDYVLPEEGPFLWGDNFVIPANSPNKHTAELFLNFLLEPEQVAESVNEYYYATAIKGAYPLIAPEILDDPVVFPPNEQLKNGELLLPLSPEGEKLYAEIWDRFTSAVSAEQ